MVCGDVTGFISPPDFKRAVTPTPKGISHRLQVDQVLLRKLELGRALTTHEEADDDSVLILPLDGKDKGRGDGLIGPEHPYPSLSPSRGKESPEKYRICRIFISVGERELLPRFESKSLTSFDVA